MSKYAHSLQNRPLLTKVQRCRHVVRAAQNAINLDERQVNAVAARIELDLRIGYAFTRFNTLTLQTMGGDLSERVISYGVTWASFDWKRGKYSLTLSRILPISHFRFRRRQILQGQELCARAVLEHQSDASS